MKKVYAVSVYREISDPAKFSAYAVIAAPAIEKVGGRFLARGMAVTAYEEGLLERTVVVEYPSLSIARGLYEGEEYRKALDALDGTAKRDIRLVEAL